MITQAQFDTLMRVYQKSRAILRSALKTGINRETAAKYIKQPVSPTQRRTEAPARTYRTRIDPLIRLWPLALKFLESTPELSLQPKALFLYLVANHPIEAAALALRTFQDRVRSWRAQNGPPKEVFFPQQHEPGACVQFDWFCANELKITINGAPYPHLLGHAVFPFSNWEWVGVCLSESLLSLRMCLQDALWRIDGVPGRLQVDNSSAATHTIKRGQAEREFNTGFMEFCRYLRLEPRAINVAKPNENGDAEVGHNHLKRRLDTHLLLRGSRDFHDVDAYTLTLGQICSAGNQLRSARVALERRALRALPARRYPETDYITVRVSSFSTVKVKSCIYSVPSRLRDLVLQAHVSDSWVWFLYERREVARFAREPGRQAHIDFRHVITWLARKPGAFRHYVHREELFPSIEYRQAYDRLVRLSDAQADRRYLQVLLLAAEAGVEPVAAVLGALLRTNQPPLEDAVRARLQTPAEPASLAPMVPNLKHYDWLRQAREVCV